MKAGQVLGIAASALVLAILGAVVWRSLASRSDEHIRSRAVFPANAAGSEDDYNDYAKASPEETVRFPADHGPHPDYLTEWWYYTGNVQTDSGRPFGYQLTFFRRALRPPTERTPRESNWGTEQIYLAHFALTDAAGSAFHAFERLSRGAAGLAGARAVPFEVWLEGWQVRETGPDQYHLRADADGVQIDLTLQDRKGPILQGSAGYSQKGPDPGDASYYYSQTRLVTRGEIVLEGDVFPVEGTSWMDHEYSTSALSAGQVGWDWFALQLDDGTEVLVYELRRSDGSVDRFSSGMLIGPQGERQPLMREDFSIVVEGEWRSPRSGATYPSGWHIQIPGAGLDLTLQPLLRNQELNLTYTYWEGAVRVTGTRQDAPVDGVGYAELTGYAGSFAGEF